MPETWKKNAPQHKVGSYILNAFNDTNTKSRVREHFIQHMILFTTGIFFF